MLYTGVNQFNWSANNFSDLYPGNAAATTLTADAVAHTKGADTALLAGVAEDVYGIYILVNGGDTAATVRRQMIDLLIDPAAGVGNAGSSWTVFINNLYTSGPSIAAPLWGYQFYFPLFLKAGTAIGARVQDVVGAGTCRFSIRVQGKPTRPDLIKVGNKVQTIGATTATTTGVAFTPGTTAIGTYSATLGTLTDDAWWWQVGIGTNDTSQSGDVVRIDVANDATSKYICMRSVFYSNNASEQGAKSWNGEGLPIFRAPSGTDVYVRGHASGAPDSGYTAVVYAVT